MDKFEFRVVAVGDRSQPWLPDDSLAVPANVEVWADRQQRRTGANRGLVEDNGVEWEWRRVVNASRCWRGRNER